MSFIITDDLIALTDAMITPRSEATGYPDENMLVLNDLGRCFRANDVTKNTYLLDINFGAVTEVAALVLANVNFDQYMIGRCDDGVNYSVGAAVLTSSFNDQADVDLWTEVGSVATSVASGVPGNNCVKVLESSADKPYIYRDYAVTPGQAYVLGVYHKDIDSTGKNPTIRVRPAGTSDTVAAITPTAAANWTWQGLYFVVPTGCTTIRIFLIHNTTSGVGDAYYFDSLTLNLADVGGVISQDDETGRYNVFADLSGIPFNNQYMRLYIPQSATAVGDYTDKWQIGSLACLASAPELVKGPYEYEAIPLDSTEKVVKLGDGGSREIITSRLHRWSAELRFGNLESGDDAELKALNRLRSPIVFYENDGDTSKVYICRRDGKYSSTFFAPGKVRGGSIRFVEH